MDGLANLTVVSLIHIHVVIMLNTVSIFLIINFIVVIVITAVFVSRLSMIVRLIVVQKRPVVDSD